MIEVTHPGPCFIPRHRRRGSFLLWTVLITLFIFLAWAANRAFVTATTRDDAQSIVEARVSQLLAESVVAEIESRIGAQVNADAKGEGLFELMRFPIMAGDLGETDLSFLVDPEKTRNLFESEEFRGYALESHSGRILFQEQIDNVPYEKKGLLYFKATVTSPGLVRSSRRSIEIARWFRTTLVTLPRPFGDFGWFVLDASGLYDGDKVNAEVETAATRLRQHRDRLARLQGLAPEAFQGSWAALLAGTHDPEMLPEDVSLPSGASLYGLIRGGSPQNLDELKLDTYIETLNQNSQEAILEFQSKETDITVEDETIQKGLMDAAFELSQTIARPLFKVWAFTEAYEIIPDGDSATRKAIESVRYKVTSGYFWRRAHYRIRLQPGQPASDLQREFDRLASKTLNGVVWIDNPADTPLILKGRVHGKMILAIGPGGVTVDGLNASEEARDDMVTIVARSGPIRISNACRVSLMTVPPLQGEDPARILIERTAKITGAMILDHLPAGSSLRGTLDRDERQFSGYTGKDGKDLGVYENYFVGLSPRVHYRRVSF